MENNINMRVYKHNTKIGKTSSGEKLTRLEPDIQFYEVE